MWIFFCFGNAGLGLMICLQYLAERVGKVVLQEQYLYIFKRLVIGGHGEVAEFERMHVKCWEGLLGQRQGDFPTAVCTEIETDHDVSVCNGCQCVASGVGFDDGFNKFIGDALIRSEEHTSELQSRENLVC